LKELAVDQLFAGEARADKNFSGMGKGTVSDQLEYPAHGIHCLSAGHGLIALGISHKPPKKP
jgi:hypothetical protein